MIIFEGFKGLVGVFVWDVLSLLIGREQSKRLIVTTFDVKAVTRAWTSLVAVLTFSTDLPPYCFRDYQAFGLL